jgi:hypothetical protein
MASSDNPTKIHVVKTSDLDAEFNIGKNTRVVRLAAIGLTPDKLHKDGKSYWLTQEQYRLFQDLDKHIIETGSIKGYPHLCTNPIDPIPQSGGYANESIEPTPPEPVVNEAGQLATVTNNIVHPSDRASGLESAAFTGEFENGYESGYSPDRRFVQLDNNAQQAAAGLLIAEAMLTDRYLQNPDRLPTHLRQQIDSVGVRQIDPKEYAAQLIRGVDNLANFGKTA